MKFDRQKRLKRLIEMESAMCKSIGETTQLKDRYRSDCVPSEEELKRLRKRVEDIEFILVIIKRILMIIRELNLLSQFVYFIL